MTIAFGNDNSGCPRKSICVDNRIAFVAGLCVGREWVGREWVGYPDKGIPPWRDTGVELQGLAVADVARPSPALYEAEMGCDRRINVVKAGTLKH